MNANAGDWYITLKTVEHTTATEFRDVEYIADRISIISANCNAPVSLEVAQKLAAEVSVLARQ